MGDKSNQSVVSLDYNLVSPVSRGIRLWALCYQILFACITLTSTAVLFYKPLRVITLQLDAIL